MVTGFNCHWQQLFSYIMTTRLVLGENARTALTNRQVKPRPWVGVWKP